MKSDGADEGLERAEGGGVLILNVYIMSRSPSIIPYRYFFSS